ncbi:hypothetical protein FVR03_03340 [Pontibacter qinzhouensis]|uniref:Uncharacterized protein n=1 Tax=Pontibacter qinzhouensis TaxID=2603253 RepID=A0A5C8KC67_9BACT|nr:hypothetical protein [Pontibacter qinzhouensis]TXK51576.1 hypothetical protein FVR03_03340 [Pontibacter qinzhouensis]
MTRDKQAIQQLYDKVLPVLAEQLHRNLEAIIPMFHDFHLERVLDTWTKGTAADTTEEISLEKGNVQQLGLRLRLEGFQRAGVPAFDLAKDLLFKLHIDFYEVGPDKTKTWLEKQYPQVWTKNEYETIATRWTDELIETLTEKLQSLG